MDALLGLAIVLGVGCFAVGVVLLGCHAIANKSETGSIWRK